MNLVVRLLLFLFEPVMGLELDVTGFVVLVDWIFDVFVVVVVVVLDLLFLLTGSRCSNLLLLLF